MPRRCSALSPTGCSPDRRARNRILQIFLGQLDSDHSEQLLGIRHDDLAPLEAGQLLSLQLANDARECLAADPDHGSDILALQRKVIDQHPAPGAVRATASEIQEQVDEPDPYRQPRRPQHQRLGGPTVQCDRLEEGVRQGGFPADACVDDPAGNKAHIAPGQGNGRSGMRPFREEAAPAQGFPVFHDLKVGLLAEGVEVAQQEVAGLQAVDAVRSLVLVKDRLARTVLYRAAGGVDGLDSRLGQNAPLGAGMHPAL